MRHLIRLISLRHLRATLGRSLLTICGIVLGVAVVFSVNVVNSSVLASVRKSVTDVAGKTKLTVGAGVGVEEDALERVRAVPGVAFAAPIIEASAYDVNAHRRLRVLAADSLSGTAAREYGVAGQDAQIDDSTAFLNDLYGVLITTEYAKRNGLKAGDTLLLDTQQGRHAFTIHGTLEARGQASLYGGDLLFMDVFAAQIAFDRGRRFDRIEVMAAPSVDVDDLTKRLDRALDGKVTVSRPEHRSEEAERLLGGFQLSLSLASLIALFVGGFIVYNALAIAVAQRRREIGVLRALGTSRRQMISLFVGEGLLMGVLGTALGLGFGMLLARAALGTVAATVSALYVPVNVGAAVVSARDIGMAAGLGVISSVIAAFVPARRAASVDPVAAMSSTVAAADVGVSSTSTAFGIFCALLFSASGVAWLAHRLESSSLAFVVAVLLACAAVFLAPVFAAGVGSFAHRHARRFGPSALLGAVSFARNRGRNTVAIAALGMALASVVNVDALIDSMKASTDAWLGRSFRADIFVFAGTEVQAKFERPLPEALREPLRSLPGVEFVQSFRMARHSFRDQPFYLMSEDFDGYRRYNELAVVDGDLARAMPQIEAGSALAASEAFVRSFRVKVGDSVTLQTPDGPRSFAIALVYTDYRADIGILLTTQAVYSRIWRDSLVDLYSLYLKRGVPDAKVRSAVLSRWGERYGLLAIGNSDYRRDLVGLVDRSMTLSRATELIAVIVAMLGIVNALLVSVLDRKREIGVLRAIGAAREQLNRMVLTESLLVACTAALLGVILGTGLSAYVVLEALRLQVGWQIAFHLSGWVVAEICVAALIVGALSAWWPMRWAARVAVVEALQHE